MSQVYFMYIDLFRSAPDWEDPYRSWVIGPSNNAGPENTPDRLRLFTTSTCARPVECRAPNAADRFPPILDERRLRRTWQDGGFVATTLSVEELRAAKELPIRFLTSEPVGFYQFGGRIVWNREAKVMAETDVSEVWWRPDARVGSASQFLIDIRQVPLFVTYRAGSRSMQGVITVNETADSGTGIVVLPASETAEFSGRLDVIYRNELVGFLEVKGAEAGLGGRIRGRKEDAARFDDQAHQ